MKRKALTRAAAVVTAVTATAALGALPAQAATIGIPWRPTVLTTPSGSVGSIAGSDGKGEYTGTFTVDGVTQVVSWRGGSVQPIIRGLPAGYEGARATDENAAGTVVGIADDWDSMVSRVFTLDAAGFHLKDVPAGYDYAYGRAINTRGDVLGNAFQSGGGGGSAAVLWPAGGGAPVVIPQTTELWTARDLDEDGTILFSSANTGPSVWKDGVARELTTSPYSQAVGYSIRNGVVVGETPSGGGMAIRWNTPTSSPVALAGGAIAVSVNKAGLSVGYVPNSNPIYGNSIAWRGTTPGTLLPVSGYKWFQAQVAADDGSFAGYVGNDLIGYGVPVIWRKSAT